VIVETGAGSTRGAAAVVVDVGVVVVVGAIVVVDVENRSVVVLEDERATVTECEPWLAPSVITPPMATIVITTAIAAKRSRPMSARYGNASTRRFECVVPARHEVSNGGR
jgi:hypothetical protein